MANYTQIRLLWKNFNLGLHLGYAYIYLLNE